ncbi:hypothetical protein COBT_002305 [Conglomerata obtusa]
MLQITFCFYIFLNYVKATGSNFEMLRLLSDEINAYILNYVTTNANDDEEFKNAINSILNEDKRSDEANSPLEIKPNSISTFCKKRLLHAPNTELQLHDASCKKFKYKRPSEDTLNCSLLSIPGENRIDEKIYDFHTFYFKFPTNNLTLSDGYSIKLNKKCDNKKSVTKFDEKSLELPKLQVCSWCEIYDNFEETKLQIYLKDGKLWNNAQTYHNIKLINVNILLFQGEKPLNCDPELKEYFFDVQKSFKLHHKTLKIDFRSDTLIYDKKASKSSPEPLDTTHKNTYWFENAVLKQLFLIKMCCASLTNDEDSIYENLHLDYKKGLCQNCLKIILMKLFFLYDTNKQKFHLKTIYYYLLLCAEDLLYIIWFIIYNNETTECPYYICKMFFSDTSNQDIQIESVSVNVLRVLLAETFILNHQLLVKSSKLSKITVTKLHLSKKYYNLKCSCHRKNTYNNIRKFEENLMFMICILYLTPILSISYMSLFYNANEQRERLMDKLHRMKHVFVFFMHLLKITERTEPIYNLLHFIESSLIFNKVPFNTVSLSKTEIHLYLNENGFIAQQNLCYEFLSQVLGLTFNALQNIMVERQYYIVLNVNKKHFYGKKEYFYHIANYHSIREIVYKIFYPNALLEK